MSCRGHTDFIGNACIYCFGSYRLIANYSMQLKQTHFFPQQLHLLTRVHTAVVLWETIPHSLAGVVLLTVYL